MKYLKLNQSKSAILDDQDINLVNCYRWWCKESRGKSYAVGWVNGKETFLHHLLLNRSQKLEIDHINGNSLDNRRENLRRCVHKTNCKNRKINSNNRSGYRGVSFEKSTGKWRSIIIDNYKFVLLGRFNSKEDAINAHKVGSKKYKILTKPVENTNMNTAEQLGSVKQ